MPTRNYRSCHTFCLKPESPPTAHGIPNPTANLQPAWRCFRSTGHVTENANTESIFSAMSCLRCPTTIILQSTTIHRTRPRVAHATCLKPSSAPTPPMESLSRPQFTCVPRDPCRHAVGGTPPQDGTCTAPTLGAGWCRVIPMQDRDSTVSSVARLHRVFDRLPTGSLRNRLFKKHNSRHEGRHLPHAATRRVDGRPHAPTTGGSQIHAGSFSILTHQYS